MAANAVVLVPGRVSNFNSNERDPSNIFRVRALTSSGSTGGRGGGSGDAKTMISPNTSFGDIIKTLSALSHKAFAVSWNELSV